MAFFFFFIFPHVERSWLRARVNVVIAATPTQKVGGCYQQTKGNPNLWLCGSNQLFPPKQILFGPASAQDLLREGDAKPCFLAGVMQVDEAPELSSSSRSIHPRLPAQFCLDLPKTPTRCVLQAHAYLWSVDHMEIQNFPGYFTLQWERDQYLLWCLM